MSVLAAIRGLMSGIAEAGVEGHRMQVLGPDFRQRQAESAARLAQIAEAIAASRESRGRAGREEANRVAEMLLKLRATQARPEVPGDPASLVDTVSGTPLPGPVPPTPAPDPTVEFQTPSGAVAVPTPYRDTTLAQLAEELRLKGAIDTEQAVDQAGALGNRPINLGPRARTIVGVGADEPVNKDDLEILTGEAERRARAAMMRQPQEPGYYTMMTDPRTGEIYAWNAKTNMVKAIPVPGSTKAGTALPPGTQQELSGGVSVLQNLNIVARQMDDLRSDATFGPLFGRLKNVQINKLGGAGASPEEIQLATRMRALVRDVSFASGGKQLTGTEKEEFTATLPGLNDTLEQAIIKARTATELFGRALQNRMMALSPSQQNLVSPAMQGAVRGVTSSPSLRYNPDTGELEPVGGQ